MGSSINTYMGPYIKVSEKKHESQVSRNICPNEECSNHNKRAISKFCPTCGTPISTVILTELMDFALSRLEEKYNLNEDDFYMPECYSFILPNGFDGYSSYDDGDFNILNDMPVKDELFDDTRWVTLIGALIQDNVEFELAYGVVSYWS